MKKIGLLFLFIISFFVPVFAIHGLNLEQFLNVYVDVVSKNSSMPDTYKYIQVKYPNIKKGTKIYETLQKAIYLDLMPNANISLPLDKQITQSSVLNIVSRKYKLDVATDKSQFVGIDWLKDVLLQIQDLYKKPQISGTQKTDITNNVLFKDVYQKLLDNYVSDSGLDSKALMYGTVKGLVESLDDPYTSFFPPVESKVFVEELNGEYYGIGAHVEMTVPGTLLIVSPMKGSPSEKAGLVGGDRVVQIGDKIVDKNISIDDAISLIKGPAGTIVKIKILRDGKILDFSIIREKIVIDNIESKIYTKDNANICLVTISMFDFDSFNDFEKKMTEFSVKKCSKYIFDVRNNPGGSMSDVARMLDYFVPTGETSIEVISRFMIEDITASDVKPGKIVNVPVRVLVNKGSASASEIFAGVIKDYVKGASIVGEKTFGKGSVQEVYNYDDGSILKYTIAKWYTGKSKKNIDKVGLYPDIIISDKLDTVEDEVLEWAISN